MDQAFSSIDLVYQCLIDRQKAAAFGAALRKVVQPEHTVLDLGTGSGILALLAAQAGARRVIAVERDPYVADVARANVQLNHYQDVIKVIVGDAETLQVTDNKAFDVVTAEMLNTALVEECQVAAMNHLHSGKLIDAHTIILPARQDTFVSLCQADFDYHGFQFRMPQHLWYHVTENHQPRLLSDPTLLNSVHFSGMNDDKSCAHLNLTAKQDGVLNSLYLTSVTWVLEGGPTLGATQSMNPPLVIPIADVPVRSGDAVSVHVSLRFGCGHEYVHAEATGSGVS